MERRKSRFLGRLRPRRTAASHTSIRQAHQIGIGQTGRFGQIAAGEMHGRELAINDRDRNLHLPEAARLRVDEIIPFGQGHRHRVLVVAADMIHHPFHALTGGRAHGIRSVEVIDDAAVVMGLRGGVNAEITIPAAGSTMPRTRGRRYRQIRGTPFDALLLKLQWADPRQRENAGQCETDRCDVAGNAGSG